jgi:UDP-N-acetyl-D-glucosamine dehydrogenase
VRYIVAACRKIARGLRRGQLVVLESTTYPGTTRELLLPYLEKGEANNNKGKQRAPFKAGRDFYLAFSPERVDPGNTTYQIKNTPKVVGGITPTCLELAVTLYSQVVERVVPVSSPEAAEMVKLLENTFRAVNIGLVNEMALMCDRLKLDIWEIVGAAATKPFGYMPFFPGPGIGGHCIPLDPSYLAWRMKALNFEPRFIELATVINAQMPEYTVRRISHILNGFGKPVRGSRIFILGTAYKPQVSDTRESPALDVMKLLMDLGSRVSYHDFFVPELSLEGIRMRSLPLSRAQLRKADLTTILTAHPNVDYAFVLKHARAIFDARNATAGMSHKNLFRL